MGANEKVAATFHGQEAPDTAALRALVLNATPGRWGVFGMTVLASSDGTSNADTATGVCHTLYRDGNGKPRTYDADFIAAAHNETLALCDALDAATARAGDSEMSLAVESAKRRATEGHLQAVREFAWGLGASTASRDQILRALEGQPFVGGAS